MASAMVSTPLRRGFSCAAQRLAMQMALSCGRDCVRWCIRWLAGRTLAGQR